MTIDNGALLIAGAIFVVGIAIFFLMLRCIVTLTGAGILVGYFSQELKGGVF
jgi:hypothetical protein